jgi:hypothetical protein
VGSKLESGSKLGIFGIKCDFPRLSSLKSGKVYKPCFFGFKIDLKAIHKEESQSPAGERPIQIRITGDLSS